MQRPTLVSKPNGIKNFHVVLAATGAITLAAWYFMKLMPLQVIGMGMLVLLVFIYISLRSDPRKPLSQVQSGCCGSCHENHGRDGSVMSTQQESCCQASKDHQGE